MLAQKHKVPTHWIDGVEYYLFEVPAGTFIPREDFDKLLSLPVAIRAALEKERIEGMLNQEHLRLTDEEKEIFNDKENMRLSFRVRRWLRRCVGRLAFLWR